MISFAMSQKVSKAYEIHFELLDLVKLLFLEGNPTGVKELMSQLSFCSNILRLPLLKASNELSKKISNKLKEINYILQIDSRKLIFTRLFQSQQNKRFNLLLYKYKIILKIIN